MQQLCRQCSAPFDITPDDLAFYDKVSPVFNGKKELIPPPTLCPECRMRRRLTFRNDRVLYPSQSSLSGRFLLSMYHPNSGLTVYDQEEWWGDGWDALTYGRAFDVHQSFFAQFSQLFAVVPRFNVYNRDTENCAYVNNTPHSKNCYLLFGSWFNEDCYYGHTVIESRTCLDNLYLQRSELSWECVDCENAYRAFFCFNCTDIVDSYLCFDCKNVRNCIGCTNLRQKEYHLFNQPCTKEEYENAVSRLQSYRGWWEFLQRFTDIRQHHAMHQALTGFQNENVVGDSLFRCKNVRQCFSLFDCQDIAYSARVADSRDSMDLEGIGTGELLYENLSVDFSYQSMFNVTCEQLKYALYCNLCFECSHCFGCIGLRHKQYCILNKQYTKEEYEALVPKIIEYMRTDGGWPATNRSGTSSSAAGSPATGSWGEFFPVTMSPFAYNETVAQEYFPMTKEEVLARGWKWRDQTDEMPKVEKIIPATQLPDSIDDIPDDILNWAIECGATKRPFKIIKQELEFYRNMRLPVPRLHPDERHRRRMALRNPRKLWDRHCVKCQQPIATSYAPERPEIVYCEECYLGEVY